MSRVVTSADIDALNRVVQRQAVELGQTNERLARAEAQIAALQGNFKALEENLIGPDPNVGVLEMPGATLTPLERAYGAGLHENVIARDALLALGAGQQQANEAEKAAFPNDPTIDLTAPGQPADPYAKVAEKILKPEDFSEAAGPDAEDGPEFEGFAERAGRDPASFLSDGGPVTDSAPAADAGVSVGGE